MVDVVADTSSLTRSGTGSVIGPVFLRGPMGAFPEDGWTDFPVVILGWWIEGLTAVVAGKERSFQGMFMDGPFAFVVKRGVGTTGRIAWGTAGEEAPIGIVDVAAFLRSAVDAGRQVADVCHANGWNSRDLDGLDHAIARSAV